MSVDKILYKAAMFERRASALVREATGDDVRDRIKARLDQLKGVSDQPVESVDEPMAEELSEAEPILEDFNNQELIESNNILVKEVESTLDKLSAQYDKLEISNLASISDQMVSMGEAPLLTGQIINVYAAGGSFSIFFGLERADSGMKKYYYLYNDTLSLEELQKHLNDLEYIYEKDLANSIKSKYYSYMPSTNIGDMLREKVPHLFSKNPVNLETTFEDDE